MSEILLPIKSPVASADFWIFEVVLSASVADGLAWSRGFWLYFSVFTYIFANFFTYIFTNIQSLDWTESTLFFIFYTLINN